MTSAPDAGGLYPLGLRIAGRAVLVVGGGPVAARRAAGLVAAHALVTVVAPEAGADLRALIAAGGVTWRDRPYATGDLDGMWLAHTATGVREVDERVAADAEAVRIWCVVASDRVLASAWTPAVGHDAGLTVAVHADGDPRRAAAVRDAVLDGLDSGALDRPVVRTAQSRGRVVLVGGGPGDPALLTDRARRLLRTADVVIADRLGATHAVARLAPHALTVDVGKLPGHHPVPQAEINALLVEHARAGRLVVRLKGGDPFVFGRGGEEAAYCRQHDVAVEVVPGVTSAIAVPAAAGIPVTHRGVADRFTVVTGHEGVAEVAGGRDHTVLILMGVSALAASAGALAATDRGGDCPVAIVEDSGRRVTFGTLATIAAEAERAAVRSPAVIVVGDVVLLSPLHPSRRALLELPA